MSASDITSELEELQKEFEELAETHRNYVKKIDEVKSVQKKCLDGIKHQRYRMKQIGESLRKLLLKTTTDEEKQLIEHLRKQITVKKSTFRDMEEVLPHTNGLYLTIILGSVNVSLLSKADKFKYKEDYEYFKLVLCIITFIVAMCLMVLPFFDHRWVDAAFHFLLVWYYCTLTIRENILIVNGSRIKGWWVTHHFISTACAGILLIWPNGVTYRLFRHQFLVFTLYLSVVQFVQYYYQRGCLYRLRSLGERHNMDITVEGFQSWMWKGLSFVLPFLFTGYAFQLYNAYTLYHLTYHPQFKEWQIPALSAIFLTLALGNIWTTFGVIRQKLQKDWRGKQYKWRHKYNFYNFLYQNNSKTENTKVKDI